MYDPWSDGVQDYVSGWAKGGRPNARNYYSSGSAVVVAAVEHLNSILDGWAGLPDPIIPLLFEYEIPPDWIKGTNDDEPGRKVHFLNDTPSRIFAPTSITRYTDPWSWQRVSNHVVADKIKSYRFDTNDMTVVAMDCLTANEISKPYIFNTTTAITRFLHTFYPPAATGR